jgi:hypothetical protein
MNTEDNEMTIVDSPVKNNEEVSKPVVEKEEDKSNMWRRVAIGGATGILLGVSGAAVASTMTGGSPEHPITDNPVNGNDSQVDVATNINDNMSFGDAFAAARAEVGPGGVFHWRGNVYSTYIEKEWDEMSSEDRAAFGERVAPEIAKEENEHPHHQETHQHHEHASNDNHEIDDSDVSVVNDDPDVRLIGVQDVTMEDGSVQTIGAATVNGYDVVLVDMNHNGEFDYAGVDVNQNGYIDADERMDISDSHISVSSFRQEAGDNLIVQKSDETDDSDIYETPMTSDSDWLSDDSMPDYTNDSELLG